MSEPRALIVIVILSSIGLPIVLWLFSKHHTSKIEPTKPSEFLRLINESYEEWNDKLENLLMEKLKVKKNDTYG